MMRVLMTGAGSPGGPGILKSLIRNPDIELFIADMDPFASGRFLHSNFFLIPQANDPAFINVLKSICRENKIDVILPLVTRELSLLAEHLETFSALGTKIIVSERIAMEKLNDKGRLYDTLRDNFLPHPEYQVVETADELLQQVAQFLNKKTACVIKPCLGNGSRGIRVICDDVDRFDLLFNYKPNALYMSSEELELVVKARAIPRMIVSEYLPGDEVTVDTLSTGGRVELVLVRRRTKMSGGISTRGEFILHDQIERSVRDLCAVIPGLNGPIGFQLRQNTDGFYHFIESNPRIQGTSVAAAGLGINFPRLAVDSALGRPIVIPERRDGIAFVRYYEEIFYDL